MCLCIYVIVANLFSQKMDIRCRNISVYLRLKKKGGVQQTKHNGFSKTFFLFLANIEYLPSSASKDPGKCSPPMKTYSKRSFLAEAQLYNQQLNKHMASNKSPTITKICCHQIKSNKVQQSHNICTYPVVNQQSTFCCSL